MTPDISVVIPTFRRPEPLSQAMSSVLSQRDVSVEIFVVDDSPEGSARASVAAIDDCRINYMRNETPTGGVPSIVRNLAWPLARGRFIHFLDDDDVVPHGHYARVLAAFDQHPDVGMVFGCVSPFGGASPDHVASETAFFDASARLARLSRHFGTRIGYTTCMMFLHVLFICSAAVTRRDCVVAQHGFDANVRLMEDTDFFAFIIRKYGAHFLDEVAIEYRVGSESLMHSPVLSDQKLAIIATSRARSRHKYREQFGTPEYIAMKAVSRALRGVVSTPRVLAGLTSKAEARALRPLDRR